MLYNKENFMDAPWDSSDEREKFALVVTYGPRGWRLVPPRAQHEAHYVWPGPFDSEETANLCLIAHRLAP